MADYRLSIGDRGVNFRFIDIDLSTARNNEPLSIAGNYLFCPEVAFDSETVISTTLETGNMFLRLGKRSAMPVYFAGGYEFPTGEYGFDEIFVTNAAQTGKMLRLYYSDGLALRPWSAQSLVTVANASEMGGPLDMRTSSFAGGILTGGATNTHVTPAANTNGIIVYKAWVDVQAVNAAIIARSSAPGAPTSELYDEYSLVFCSSVHAAASNTIIQMPYPVIVPSGLGLYSRNQGASGTGYNVVWRVL